MVQGRRQRQGCSTSGGQDTGKGAFRAFVANIFLLKIVKPAVSSHWYGSDQCLTSDCSSGARFSGFQAGRSGPERMMGQTKMTGVGLEKSEQWTRTLVGGATDQVRAAGTRGIH